MTSVFASTQQRKSASEVLQELNACNFKLMPSIINHSYRLTDAEIKPTDPSFTTRLP